MKHIAQSDERLPTIRPLTNCMRRGNNEEFLSRTTKYAEKRKWAHLVAAFKTALAKVGAL